MYFVVKKGFYFEPFFYCSYSFLMCIFSADKF